MTAFGKCAREGIEDVEEGRICKRSGAMFDAMNIRNTRRINYHIRSNVTVQAILQFPDSHNSVSVSFIKVGTALVKR